MNTPSGGSGVTSGEYIVHHKRKAGQRVLVLVRRCIDDASDPAPAIAHASPSCRSASPSASAASSTLASTRRWPLHHGESPAAYPAAARLRFFRRSRSVGQRGRKSEMTLRIACLHNPGMRLATSDAQQFDMPDAGVAILRTRSCVEGLGETRQRVDAAFGSPASSCSPALRQRRATSAVTPDLSRAKLQAGARPSAKACVTSPTTPARPLQRSAFLHRRQHVAIFPGLAVDDAVGMQADARERRGEEIATAQAPQHRPGMRARIPAANKVAAAAYSLAGPPSITSCRWPRAIPPPGRCPSIDGSPKGNTAVLSQARMGPACSRLPTQFGNSHRLAGEGHPQSPRSGFSL